MAKVYGDVLTYREEAKARELIGKECVFSDDLQFIEEHPEKCKIAVLGEVGTEQGEVQFYEKDDDWGSQFIREVKND